MLSIGLLSWKAHQTLRKTLESYVRAGLAKNADEFKIFFNEISEETTAPWLPRLRKRRTT